MLRVMFEVQTSCNTGSFLVLFLHFHFDGGAETETHVKSYGVIFSVSVNCFEYT